MLDTHPEPDAPELRSMTVAPRSLTARITLLVFAATLVTSLTVTGISVQSIDSFLRAGIDQRFPDLLRRTARELDNWYELRERELEVFAGSAILRESLPSFAPQGKARSETRRGRRAREDAERYLGYVLESFTHYQALVILDHDGEPLLWVGEEVPLPPAFTESVRTLGATRTSDIMSVVSTEPAEGGRPAEMNGRIQLISTPLDVDGTSAAATLHAVVALDALTPLLQSQELGETGEIFIVGADGRYLAESRGPLPAEVYSGVRPDAADAPSEVHYYTSDRRQRVVGAGLALDRLGWSLVAEQSYNEAFAPVVSSIGRVVLINLAIVVLFGLAALRIAASVVHPIRALSEAARRLSKGERRVVLPEEPEASTEVAILTRTFNEMSRRLTASAEDLEVSHNAIEEANARLQTKNEELSRMNDVLEQLSITDGLTKLHNHRYFQEGLTREAKRADRSARPLSLILIDIDYFKLWNDRLGHAAGDEILRRLAEVMNRVVRETDILARYGGEEFALLAPNTELEGAVNLAEKIRAEVSATAFFIEPPSETSSVTVSVGVAAYRGDRRRLFNDADRALYQAKEAGRDCVVVAGAEESPDA